MPRSAPYLRTALGHPPPEIAAGRASQMAGFIVRACAGQARLLDTDPPPRLVLGIEAFTANLVDVLPGILQTATTVRANGRPPATELTQADGRASNGRK